MIHLCSFVYVNQLCLISVTSPGVLEMADFATDSIEALPSANAINVAKNLRISQLDN
jgi:hypothetical protein